MLEISERYGFNIDPKKKIYEMSVSEKQTVEIIKVLYRGAEILILDEPTAGLDPLARNNILKLISDLHSKKNITVILVSHSMEDIARIVEKVMVMSEGRLVMFDTVKNVFAKAQELQKIGLNVPQISLVVNELKRRGVAYSFGAADYWLWNVLGSLIVIGPFVYLHKMFKATNLMNAHYNVNG